MAWTYSEPGHTGQLVSLGGVVDNTGNGRQLRGDSATLGTTVTQILGANPGRIAALISNDGADNVYVFGKALSAVNAWAVLRPGGSFQIDQSFPWTGEVNLAAVAANANCYWVEVSING